MQQKLMCAWEPATKPPCQGVQGRINSSAIGSDEAEAQILEMVNWIGDAMGQEVVTGLAEPTTANQITIGGEVAVFERVRNLRFINRFGEEVVRARRNPMPTANRPSLGRRSGRPWRSRSCRRPAGSG